MKSYPFKYIHTAIFLVALVSFLGINTVMGQSNEESVKVARYRKRAHNNYEHFNYLKAVRHYKKLLNYKPEDQEAHLRIADSYRRMGQNKQARDWYGKAENQDLIQEKEDVINYAHVLATLGEYELAKDWYEAHGMEGEYGEVASAKLNAIKNMSQFFEDTTAYFMENVPFNSEFSDFAPSYGHGGVVYASARAGTGIFKPKYNWDGSSFLDLYYVKDHHGSVQQIEGGINTRYHEGPAAFYLNDTKVIFTRNNFNKGVAGESEEGVNTLHLFSANRETKSDDWKNVERLWFNTDHHSFGHPTVTADGTVMYFASDMPGSLGGSDIYKTEYMKGKWSEPVNMGKKINTSGNEFFPFIHEEGILYFASDGLHGIGGLDIYHLDLKDPDAQPLNMGSPINTSKDDFGLILDSLGMSGYLSSNREGGKGHDDIYYFEKFIYGVRVLLVDAETGRPIQGNLRSNFQDVWGREQNLESKGELSYRIIKGRHMNLTGSAEGYLPKDSIVMALMDTDQKLMEVRIPLEKHPVKQVVKDLIVVVNNQMQTQIFVKEEEGQLMEYEGDMDQLRSEFKEEGSTVGTLYTYRNIYYDFDKSFIREDASRELEQITSLLDQYPKLKIQLSSHTDIRGSIEYNRGLAKRRVKSAKKHLTKLGITKERILIDSFGEEELFDDCSGDCDENKHQSNRRTEIKLFF